MKIYFMKAAMCATLTLTTLFFAGCSKSYIEIYTEDNSGSGGQSEPSNGSDNGNNEQKALITFHATVESRNLTRSMSPMPEGVASLMFAFESPINNLNEPNEEGLYVTSTAGVMTGANNYKMYLPNGIYTFYAVSNNTYSTPPQFIDGVSHPLINGVDYLWANNKLQDVTSQQVNIPLTFFHSATQVVFKVSSSPNLTLNKLVSATITPSKPGGKMMLFNGDITPATAYDATPVNMGINGTTAQYIMLPLQTDSPMKLVLTVLANSETTPRTYSVDVPIPNGELKSGDSYLFSAILDENSVSFAEVNIINWTDVDETGKPLYPIQN